MEPIRYAKNGDVHLAYQVVGEGDRDIVWVPGWFSDLETMWDVPGFGWFLRELSGMGRLILFDKRGMGQSDRITTGEFPSFEERTEDVIAVMDAAGVQRAALVGVSEGGSQALLTAALHPERVTSVAALSAWVRVVSDPDDEPGLGIAESDLRRFVARAGEAWGSGRDVAIFAPSRVDDDLFVERWANFQRRAASPSAVEGYGETLPQLDIRDALPLLTVPTLVLSSVGDRMVPSDQFRHLAEHVPEVRAVELPGSDHVPFFDAPELLLEEIERHLTGRVRAQQTVRRFASVLLTDIVGSTDRAAAVGDRSWTALLGAYEAAARRAVGEHGGEVVKSTGDGTLGTFPDPQAALLCARMIHRELAGLGIAIRAGLHVGQFELRGDDIGGIAVHIAARVADAAGPGETFVSSTFRDVLLGSGFEFAPRGTRELKGIPGEWALYALDDT